MEGGAAHHLLDLPDELLVQCAVQLASFARRPEVYLSQLSAVNRTFARLLRDDEAASMVWTVALHSGLGWHHDMGRRASAQLYHSLSTIKSAKWHKFSLVTSRSNALSLLGRSSSASCSLGSELLMYGGTLNGNFGPLLDDLLVLSVDRVNGCITVRCAVEPEEGRDVGADPGPRRGHSMTVTSLPGGEEVACIIGGWSDGEVPMMARLLHRDADRVYHWRAPALSGSLPHGRAFHTATEVASSRLLVYGGLGTGCCRTDVALLDLRTMTWSAPRLGGVPRCVGGRAGHGAVFFPRLGVGPGGGPGVGSAGGSAGVSAGGRHAGNDGGGELLLLSGAMRSSMGDSHQVSLDVIEVQHVGESDVAELHEGGESSDGECDPDTSGTYSNGLKLRWSDETTWSQMQLPPVRTAFYAPVARSVLAWSGVSEGHGLAGHLHVVDVDQRQVRELTSQEMDEEALVDEDGADTPCPRGGALYFPLSPCEAIMFIGSDHDDGAELLTPWVLEVPLPGCGQVL